MKTTMMKYMMLVLLTVLTTTALATGYPSFGASAPEAVSFQSTSTLSGGAYSSGIGAASTVPAIGEGGIAAAPASAMHAPAGPARNTTNPSIDDDDEPNPIGDAVLPLLLLAMTYLIIRARARAKQFLTVAAAILTIWPAAAVTFDGNTRYSKEVIDACIYNFKANTKQAGFNTYDVNGTKIATSSDERGFDYVPGLVAKGVMEAVNYYKSEDFAKPWFYSIEDYGNTHYNSGFTKDQADLDKLNAVKLYFGLKEAANTGIFTHVNASTVTNCNSALAKATQALTNYNTSYAITSATSQAYCGAETFTGGWWHKSTYQNEMWCDGQYMGPALLAELLHNNYTLTGKTETECWDIIANQFNMTWGKLWDSEKKLLWHAFSAKPADDTNWADQTSGTHYGVSAEYWGRAEGWYFLALVDVLELMPTTHPQYATLKQHLNDIADGLKDRQLANGCWAQLLQYAVGYTPAGGSNSNYAESSATAIFTAAYLKGMRLHLFTTDYETVAKNAYQGFIEQFYTDSGSDVILTNSCASAGLSDTRKGDAKYYLDGSDVKRITTYTEGKVLGAFILAAVEYERAYLPAPSGSTCDCLTVDIR